MTGATQDPTRLQGAELERFVKDLVRGAKTTAEASTRIYEKFPDAIMSIKTVPVFQVLFQSHRGADHYTILCD